AVGGVLYWLLTGRDPFHYRTDAFALIKAHLTEAPAPPSSLSPGTISASLDRVVLRALAKHPDDRFETAEELSAALARAPWEEPIPRWLPTERLDTSVFQGAGARMPGDETTIPVSRAPASQARLTAGRLRWIALLAAVASLIIVLVRTLALR